MEFGESLVRAVAEVVVSLERWSKLQERADRASRREDSLQKQTEQQWERLSENVPNRNEGGFQQRGLSTLAQRCPASQWRNL